jgi:hypothetical protein
MDSVTPQKINVPDRNDKTLLETVVSRNNYRSSVQGDISVRNYIKNKFIGERKHFLHERSRTGYFLGKEVRDVVSRDAC